MSLWSRHELVCNVGNGIAMLYVSRLSCCMPVQPSVTQLGNAGFVASVNTIICIQVLNLVPEEAEGESCSEEMDTGYAT